mgnify:FL=1
MFTRPGSGGVTCIDSTESTNTDMAEFVKVGGTLPRMLVASHQDSGRGRFDRRWQDVPGTAVAMSVLVPADRPAEDWGWLSLICGLAMVETIEGVTGATRDRVTLKWPNDVLLDQGSTCMSALSDNPAPSVIQRDGSAQKMAQQGDPVLQDDPTLKRKKCGDAGHDDTDRCAILNPGVGEDTEHRRVDADGSRQDLPRTHQCGDSVGTAHAGAAKHTAGSGDVGTTSTRNGDTGHGGKVCGILCERVEGPAGTHAILGIGLNVSMDFSELPVPTATSLRLCGLCEDKNLLIATLLRRLDDHVTDWLRTGNVRQAYRERCDTVGQRVRLTFDTELIGGGDTVLDGVGVDVDDTGAIIVATPEGRKAFAAGDVTHLRPR